MVENIELHCVLVFILLTIANEMFIRAQDVGSPSDVTVCIGKTATTACHFEYHDGNHRVVPHWRFSNGSGVLFSLNGNESKNGLYHPWPGMNDSEAILIVTGDPKIDGYRMVCRLPLQEPIDSPNNGTIKVIEPPSCPENVSVQNAELNFISVVIVTWQQSNTQPVAATTVTYCPTSSPNCRNIVNCSSPCNISGLDPGTEYQFTIIPNNECGTPPECAENKANLTTIIIGITPPVAGIPVEGLVFGSVLAVTFFICFVSMIICRYCYKSLTGCLKNVRNRCIGRATKNKVNDTKRKEEEICIAVVDSSEHTGSTVGTTAQLDCSLTSTSQ